MLVDIYQHFRDYWTDRLKLYHFAYPLPVFGDNLVCCRMTCIRLGLIPYASLQHRVQCLIVKAGSGMPVATSAHPDFVLPRWM